MDRRYGKRLSKRVYIWIFIFHPRHFASQFQLFHKLVCCFAQLLLLPISRQDLDANHMVSKKRTDPLTKPQFFRVLLPGSGFSTKLPLPRSLAKYFIKENHKRATILSLLGKPWHIKVHGDTNTLYFGDGWQEFAQAHDLVEGYVLVFSYEGDMVFDVSIFDKSACEKVYTPMVGNGVINHRIKREEQKSANATKGEVGMHSCRTIKLPTHSRDYKASEQASERSACLVGQHFKVTIKPSYLGPKPSMNLPSEVSHYLLDIDKMLLRDPEDRLWPVKLYHSFNGAKKRTRIGSGWREFHVKNNLEEGDVCIFELVSNKIVMMHVHIQKHKEQSFGYNSNVPGTKHSPGHLNIGSMKHLTSSSTQPAVEKRKLVHSQDKKVSQTIRTCMPASLFKVIIKSCNLLPKAYMTIPSSFQVLNGIHQIILRDPKQRRWPVKILHKCRKTKSYATFGSGWQNFFVSNNLEEGDVCIFELVSKEKAMMHVHIQKHKEQDFGNNSNGQRTIEAMKHLTGTSTQPAVKKTKLVHSQDQKVSQTISTCMPASLFKATIKSCNLLPKPYMKIPSSFQVLNGLSGIHQIILRDLKRRRWPVQIRHKCKKDKKYASFGLGWQKFCASNDLEEGDVCIFEYIENSNVMIVDILKEQARVKPQRDSCGLQSQDDEPEWVGNKRN